MRMTARAWLLVGVMAVVFGASPLASAEPRRFERIPGMSEADAQRLIQAEAARLEKHGLREGMMLDKQTAQLAKGLLPPELLQYYEKGEFYNEIRRFPAEINTDGPTWDKASAENAQHIVLDPSGLLIDKRTGKDPGNLQGWPFPTIDSNDPSAAMKIFWNNQISIWAGIQSSAFYLDITLLNRTGIDRNLRIFTYQNHWIATPPRLLPAENPDNILKQSLTVVEGPQDVYGTAQLNVRFRDDKRDMNWAYVPALRRVRMTSPANRSDGFLGSDISADDGSYFDGKVTEFDFKLVGEAEMLCLADPLSMQGLYPKRIPSPKYPGAWRDFTDPNLRASGFAKDGWKGVPWAPADQVLVVRPVWIIELVPRDKYYLYGKIQLSIDKDTWEGCYNRKWSWQGELLHVYASNHNLALPQQQSDGSVDYFDAGLVIFRTGINFKLDRGSNVNFPPDVWIDRQATYPKGWFDYQALHRFGK